jgi:hypothetical protein
MRAEKKCKWLRPLPRKSDGFGSGISAHGLEMEEDHMATKPMNLNAGLEGLQTLVKTKAQFSIAGWPTSRSALPLLCECHSAVIFFAHGAQKMFGWFGTMQYFTQSLHIPAPLAAVAILVELLGGLAW